MGTRGSIGDLITEGFATTVFGRRETQRIPVRTSTNQAEAIYLPTAAPGLGDSGVIIGREVYSGKGYVYDPFQLYGQQLPAPHWLVLGESGNGKSALEKTYVLRQLRFRDRQVVVLDAQGEDGVGEWNLIAHALGVKPVRLDPHARGGVGVRLNPLDPSITQTGQLALLRTIVEVALSRSLDERPGYALKAAHATVRADALRAGVQPILHDVVDALREPMPQAADEMNIALDDLREWGLDVALVLDRLVDGDLAGMFDGPTTDGIDLDSPLIVFDLSTIDRNSIAMPILMAIVGVWLEHSWLRPDRRKRIFLVEEAWHIINEPSVAQLFQRLLKFGRRLGLSFVAVVHHLSDVVDGAAAKEASAILKMASTRTIYAQKTDEARATGRVLGLPRWAVEIIPTLSPGIAVWDVNGDVQVVKHIVTEHEKPLVFTDRAMTESSQRPQPPVAPPAAPRPLGAAVPAPELAPTASSAARALPPTRANVDDAAQQDASPVGDAVPLTPVVPVVPAVPAVVPTVAPAHAAPPAAVPASAPPGPPLLPPTSSARLAPAPLPPTSRLPPLRAAAAAAPLPPPVPAPVPMGHAEQDPNAQTRPALPLPPPHSRVAPTPPADDPELTALAAALFGPRAQTPSHPRDGGPGSGGPGGSGPGGA